MRTIATLSLLLGCFLLQPAFAQQTYPVRFFWGTEFFPDNYQAIRQNPDVKPADIVNGYYTRFIQCAEIPTAAMRAGLEEAGVQFITYLHYGAYLVALPEQFDLGKLDALKVRSIVPVLPEWKLARTLREKPYGSWAVEGDQVDIYLQVYPHVRIPEAAAWCGLNGLTVVKEGNQNGILQVRLHENQIAAAAALPFVRHLELLPPPSQPDDVGGRSLHRSNLLDVDHPLGRKFNGEGVAVMVRDDGPLGPHIDFQGRNTDVFGANDTANGTHGDGVGGVMSGAGNLNPVMKGMAAGATMFTIRYQADFQDNTMDLHLQQGVTITNSSYSNGCNVGYTTITQTIEQQLLDNPTLMHVFSAGNANGSDCGYGAGDQWGNITGGHKMAKNAIATANLHADGALEESSSRGPAHDGRLKPDISAHGQNQNSTDHNNTYQVFGGTSAAAPGIAGCLAQLTQAYKELHSGQQPDAALLKVALLNTANEMGNVGPDYKFGWGHVNNWRAYQLLANNRYLTGSVEQGMQSTHTIQIPAGTRQAKIMVYWVERPADENAARALINDLDLTVTAPGGTVNLPWRLDPTPDPILLDTPAGKGRDSLNNMEQVTIDNPAAGMYTVNVNGFEVPFGPQAYYLAWEFYNDDVKLTYPAGGEGLVPGEVCRIQWDAYGTATNFTLRYSTDNAQTFLPITTTPGANRMFDWTVPNQVNGRIKVLIIRGSKRDTTDFALTIAPVPADLKIDKVCPDSMTVSWTAINDTLQYDVYTLGQKYMEIVGSTGAASYTLPIQNAGVAQWVSVRAAMPGGLAGRRALAVNWPGGLLNCKQPDDVALGELLSPLAQDISAIVSCDAIQTTVKAHIVNEGTNPISGAQLSYQLNNEPPVTETLPDIAAGATLDYTFMQALTVSQNGNNTLLLWSTYADEDVFFNDTLSSTFFATVKPENSFFTQGFQGATFPPTGWKVENPDGGITWARTAGNVTGPAGTPTRAITVDCYNYSSEGEEDYLYLVPVDLSGLPSPGVRFDLAHANYDSTYYDSLRIEVFADCDLNATPAVIWGKGGPSLATTLPSTASFGPDNASDWRTEVASLLPFANQTVIIRFVSVNDFGNNIFIDNIGLLEYDFSPPVANLVASEPAVCRLDTITYTAIPSGTLTSYTWLFGSGAQPSNATGVGPHNVRYLTPGNKNVRLIVSNSNGADTALQVVPVFAAPVTNFTWSATAGTVTFTNTSANGQSYLWNFGDGNTSTEVSPVHIYAAPGAYTVTLTVTNVCSSTSKSQTFDLTFVGTQELAEISNIRILPNPTEGDFMVELNSLRTVTLQLHLLDAQGRLVKTIGANTPPGVSRIPFEGLNLSKGLYQLQVQTESGVRVLSVAVQ
ncbi:MAG: S8 family serine peptidase [Saprospirales bacterium]|nr:S8 family serine peptidase [Saprospirales bacterium]